MTEIERKNLLAYMENFIKEVSGNKEMARQFLIEVGICTIDGQLTEPYKNLYLPPIEA